MHLVLDGTVLPAIFVMAITIWACGSYIVDLFKGARTVVSIVSFVAFVLAAIVLVMAFFRL